MRWAGLRLSVSLLTAVPLRGRGPVPGRGTAAAAMIWAPAVGLAIGAAAAAVLLASLAAGLGPAAGAVLAVITLAAATRGLHLDGLADLADGLGSRAPAGRALEIMRRPDIGPYGAAALVLTLLAQVALLARAAALGRGPAAVIVAVVTGRLAMTWACRRGGPAPAAGSRLGVLVTRTVPEAAATGLTAVTLAGALLAGWLIPAGPGAGLAGRGAGPGLAAGVLLAAAAAAGLAAGGLVTGQAVRRLGGVSGDVLGAVAEISAAACLLVTAIR